MKKVLIAASLVATCFAPQAFAQAKNFEGFSVGLNAHLVSPTTEASLLGSSINGFGQQSAVGSIQGAYSFVASDAVVLSLGATYNLTDIDAGNATEGAATESLKIQNSGSIYFEPGFLASEKTLAYFKIAYEKCTVKKTDTGVSMTKDVTGNSFGFGIRTLLSKNLFLQAEAKRVQFDSARFEGEDVDFKTSATVGTIGIGYKF